MIDCQIAARFRQHTRTVTRVQVPMTGALVSMETLIDSGEILAASEFKRLPRHIGLIPDGNRRWARERGLHPSLGYQAGVDKGLEMVEHCRTLGVEEVSAV